MHIMNTTQTTIALVILCLLIALAIIFRVFLFQKLPDKIVKVLQVVAICCVAMAFLITIYKVFF